MRTLRILLMCSLAITFLRGPNPAAAQLAHPLIWMDMPKQPKPQREDQNFQKDQNLEANLESSLRKLGSGYPKTRQGMLRQLLIMRHAMHMSQMRHQVPMIDQIIKILMKLDENLTDTLERKIRF